MSLRGFDRLNFHAAANFAGQDPFWKELRSYSLIRLELTTATIKDDLFTSSFHRRNLMKERFKKVAR